MTEEIPKEWIQESEPKKRKKRKPINPFRRTKKHKKIQKPRTNIPGIEGFRWILSRVLFLFYIVLSIYTIYEYPYGLIILVPTLFVLTDYLIKIEKREAVKWWDEDD